MFAPLALAVALATGAAGERPALAHTYALIIGNNQSLGLRRPALQYADDDAVKYAELFGAMMPEQNILLLSELDRDTERLHPQQAARARLPTRANVAAALDELAARARQSQAQGIPVSFYFIFAGHGDVNEGRGYLELKDAAFTSEDLEQALRGMPSTQTHVILDSCNSFFVINPRKPGGKRFATARDVMEGLARRLPTVGVFLSTSAEAEVYEWSELQSGIFSHTVRSGLSGAADADQDGRISYAELSGFVELAAREVRNPLFRPKVFARGPAGDNRQALLELGSAQAVRLEAGGAEPVRLTVRDADGGRWLDANVEAGARVSLLLPRAQAEGMSVEQPTEQGARRASLGGGDTMVLASLAPWSAAERSRGPGELLKALYTTPFGPRALAALERERASQPEPVYGISREDVSRMNLLLGELVDIERSKRIQIAAASMLEGVIVGGGAGFLLLSSIHSMPIAGREDRDFMRAGGWTMIGLGAASIAYGSVSMFNPSEGEALAHDFQTRSALAGEDSAQLVAQTETRLHALLEREQWTHRFLQIAGWVAVGTSLVNLVSNELWNGTFMDKLPVRTLGASTLLASSCLLVSSYVERSPTERVIHLWQEDPSIQQLPRLSVQPLKGGGMLSLRGEF